MVLTILNAVIIGVAIAIAINALIVANNTQDIMQKSIRLLELKIRDLKEQIKNANNKQNLPTTDQSHSKE